VEKGGVTYNDKNNEIGLVGDTVILREFNEHDWADVHQYASQEIVCQYQVKTGVTVF